MSLSREDVQKVARLSKLRMTEADLDAMAPKLNNILGFIEQLNEVNTDDVEPLSSISNARLILRKDAITDGDCRDKVLANAPETEEGFFVVPKVVE